MSKNFDHADKLLIRSLSPPPKCSKEPFTIKRRFLWGLAIIIVMGGFAIILSRYFTTNYCLDVKIIPSSPKLESYKFCNISWVLEKSWT